MRGRSCGGRRVGAFTLLELMIVRVIIGILSRLLLPLYGGRGSLGSSRRDMSMATATCSFTSMAALVR
ncbi:MAG: prepilin-type N-terminal cleavage/methylation domain-containing protein [Chthoniobacterales bacterium]